MIHAVTVGNPFTWPQRANAMYFGPALPVGCCARSYTVNCSTLMVTGRPPTTVLHVERMVTPPLVAS
jgi:hypothetical protein